MILVLFGLFLVYLLILDTTYLLLINCDLDLFFSVILLFLLLLLLLLFLSFFFFFFFFFFGLITLSTISTSPVYCLVPCRYAVAVA